MEQHFNESNTFGYAKKQLGEFNAELDERLQQAQYLSEIEEIIQNFGD